jgi:hypothetical protein
VRISGRFAFVERLLGGDELGQCVGDVHQTAA